MANQASRAAESEGSVKRPKRASSPSLPLVSPREASAAREEVLSRRFIPSTNRLPDEVLPNIEHVTILDQGPEFGGVGYATAAALNYLRAKSGDNRPVSPRMLYDYARSYDEWSGSEHDGTSLVGVMAALWRRGVCLDSEWEPTLSPETQQRAMENRPASIRHVDKNVEHIRAAIFEHHVALAGVMVHTGWDNPGENGEIIYSKSARGAKKQQVRGAHAVAVIGYDREGFLIQNSWGTSWGGARIRGTRYSGIALLTYEDAAEHMQDGWVMQLDASPFRPPLVGYDADSLQGTDHLEIKAEVKAFSYVLASRAIKPPLAIGLFGDWGSGKSFFMQEMQRKIAQLCVPRADNGADGATPAAAAESPFCGKVVQISFNAWHYLDTDLWASIVTEIFDKLFVSIGGKTGKPEEKLPELTKQLETANGVYQQAKQQLADAERARKSAESALKLAIKAREEREATLTSMLDDVATLVLGKPDVRDDVAKLADDLGVPQLKTSYQALDAQAGELATMGRRFPALLHAMFATPWGWWRLASLVLALLAPALVLVAMEILRERLGVQIADMRAMVIQVSALVAATTAWLGAQAKRGSGILSRLEETHGKLERIREDRRKLAVANEEYTLQALKEKEDVARTGLQEAEQRVQELQREKDDLQPGRLIMRFIEDRTKSTDYKSRLGIVSLVRRDFERLSELADPDSTSRDPKLMPVDRIILYIDDLDRCSPDRVIEVLEAVHLLLAFRLFMVVVAVDPRWLRRCLEKHYPDLLALRTQEVTTVAHVVPSRPATAQDYLEKIFQIPFSLQPLKDDGFRRMIRGLTLGSVAAEAPLLMGGSATGEFETPPAPDAADAANGGDDETDSSSHHDDVDAKQGDDSDDAEHEDSDVAIERLLFREWELEDMQRLSLLFRTPRGVKRFINTYRFLRASVRPHEQSMFEGTRDEPGTYRSALVLLAIVVSYSNVAARFLRRVRDVAGASKKPVKWDAFLKQARGDTPDAPTAKPNEAETATKAPAAKKSTRASPAKTPAAVPLPPQNWEEVEWLQLCDALREISKDDFPVAHIDDLTPWIPVVARYSFSLAASATLER